MNNFYIVAFFMFVLAGVMAVIAINFPSEEQASEPVPYSPLQDPSPMLGLAKQIEEEMYSPPEDKHTFSVGSTELNSTNITSHSPIDNWDGYLPPTPKKNRKSPKSAKKITKKGKKPAKKKSAKKTTK